MFGTKLEEAFNLKPHLVDGIFQYGNLKGLNDEDSNFFNLGSVRFRPMEINNVKLLRATVFGAMVQITKHSESKLKGQDAVQSYKLYTNLSIDTGTFEKSVIVSGEVLNTHTWSETYFKDLIRMEVMSVLSSAIGKKFGGSNVGRD